jgi:hypothetical protein
MQATRARRLPASIIDRIHTRDETSDVPETLMSMKLAVREATLATEADVTDVLRDVVVRPTTL